MDIKKLKPNARSHYKQGYFDISKSTKYVGDGPAIYRSGLELKCFNVFERSAKIVEWSSEPKFIKIQYIHNGKTRNYHIDAYIKLNNGKRQIIEIKPQSQVDQPQMHKFKSNAKFVLALDLWQQNMAKWRAAFEYANANDMEFKILTDITINKFV
jgi:hypothetical protein